MSPEVISSADQYSHDSDEAATEAAERIGAALLGELEPLGGMLGKCEGAGQPGPSRLRC
jgi:hypothetical protein